MAGKNTEAVVSDESATDFPDDAWGDTNDMMRPDGEAKPAPLDPTITAEFDDEPEEGEAPEKQEAAPEEEISDDDVEIDEEELEPAVEAITPPTAWPPQEQQFFKALPPQLQHAYMDRARHLLADYTQKTQDVAKARQHYREVDAVIAPRVQQWALSGMSVPQAVSQLIALSDFASEKPEEFIKYFANMRGINLGQAFGGSDPNQQQEYVDPQVLALRQELGRVQSHLNQTAQTQQQREQQRVQQERAAAVAQTTRDLDSFASQTGPNGRLLYPYFTEVQGDMAVLIQSGRTSNLAEAYNTAVRMNPTTHAKMLARSRAIENAKAVKRAEAAKRAASSVSGAHSGNGRVPTGEMGIGELLRASLRGDIS